MMGWNKYIPLFYWSSVVFERKTEENYGDLLSVYLVEKISRKPVRFYNAPKRKKKLFKKRHLMAIGSIMTYATEKSVVWGSGIISRKDNFGKADFRAVRGPKTRERVMELGYDCPEVYGDPALLLPHYYEPQVAKTYKYGIIPHYIDFKAAEELFRDHDDIKVINLIGSDVEKITDEILTCESTISSSLHGIIVSHAYGIPSIWVEFSDKLTGDGVKFEDYFTSVGLKPYEPKTVEKALATPEIEALLQGDSRLPLESKVKSVANNLQAAFPML